MKKALTYFETGSNDPCYNLAFEEYMLLNKTEGDILLLWQNDNAVIIGRHQNAEEEIDRAFVEQNGIKVVRRTTGGGAVYHDMGNLNYSFITDVGDAESLSIQAFTQPIIAALAKMGVTAQATGRNDITIGEKKVSGNAQRMHRNRILHHGTLLFDSDSQKVAGALRADPAKFQSKSAKSVRSRIGNIKDFLAEDMQLCDFWQKLIEELTAGDMLRGSLDESDLAAIEQLADEKYRSWEWNFGSSPKYDRVNKQRFAGGTLEIKLSVAEGCITDIAFFGDFMARKATDEVADSLVGCRFEREEAEKAFEQFETEDYFGGITLDEIMQVMFY